MARYKNITGVEKIEAQLTGISRAAAEKIATALNQGADEIAQRARTLAPAGRGRRSVNSIKYGPLKSKIATMSPFEAARKSRRGLSIGSTVGSIAAGVTTGDAFYARFVEFGTSRGAAGKPFFWPAYRSVRKKIRRRVTRAVNAAAREVARG